MQTLKNRHRDATPSPTEDSAREGKETRKDQRSPPPEKQQVDKDREGQEWKMA